VEARFSAPVQTAPMAHRASYTRRTGSLSQEYSSWSLALNTHHPKSSAEVKERVQLYPIWDFMTYSSVNFTSKEDPGKASYTDQKKRFKI